MYMGTYEDIERSIFKNQAIETLAGQDYFQIFSVFSLSLVTLSTLYFQRRFSQCEQDPPHLKKVTSDRLDWFATKSLFLLIN